MQNKDYRGQGPLMFEERKPDGSFGPIKDLGDVSAAAFAPQAEEIKKRESRTGKQAVVKIIEKMIECGLTLTVGNFSTESLGLHLRSEITTEASGSKSNYAVGDLTTMEVGDIFRIPFFGVSDLVIKDSTAVTPVELVEGLHYEPVAAVAHGYFRLLSKVGITGALKGDFDYAKRESVKAMSKKKVTGRISFLGINTAESDEPQLIQALVTLSAANSFSLINDEFSTYEVSAECLFYNGGYFSVDGIAAS